VTEMGVTDDCYTDRRVLSVRPSVIISPTDFIAVADGISPSVKLVNGVVEVQPTTMGLMLRQHKYILDILTRMGMTSCKPVDTPISTSKVIILSDPLFSDPIRFRQIMGALQYLIFTRLDICFVVNRVCQFMHAPIDSHWDAVKRILRYLRGTTTYGLHFTRSSFFALHGFTYAN
jgi:histone deacetylase 1/2